MKIRFTTPYEGLGFNAGVEDPGYYIGIGSLGSDHSKPTLFAIVAQGLEPVTSMRTQHTLSRDYFTFDEAAREWSTGFEINGLGDRTEVRRIIGHLLQTQQAEQLD